MSSNFQGNIMENLNEIIMVSIWKCFPESMNKKTCFGCAGSYVQVIGTLCVWHLHSSKSCCVRSGAGSEILSEANGLQWKTPMVLGEHCQSEALFTISLEPLK